MAKPLPCFLKNINAERSLQKSPFKSIKPVYHTRAAVSRRGMARARTAVRRPQLCGLVGATPRFPHSREKSQNIPMRAGWCSR